MISGRLATGSSTGVRISTIGERSITQPTANRMGEDRQHQQGLATISGFNSSTISPGRPAMVISHAAVIAAATQNMTNARALGRRNQNTKNLCDLEFPVNEHSHEHGIHCRYHRRASVGVKMPNLPDRR